MTEDPLTDQAADNRYFKIKFISKKLISDDETHVATIPYW